MPTLVGADEFTFNDGNSGHLCDLGSSPDVDEWDVLAVNSNTVVSTPSGWTLAETKVTNQGAYWFARLAVGGEGSTVTITTSGNHNTQVSWERWSGLGTLDTSTSTEVNSSVGGSTPAHSTGVLAEADELVLAFAAIHNFAVADQVETWSAGYTPVSDATQGVGGAGIRGWVAYKTGAGTAAETPSVSWTGEGAFNRYILVLTFTTVAEPEPAPAVPATSTPTVTARRTSTGAVSASTGAWTATVAAAGTEQWVRYPALDNYPSESLYPSVG